MPHYIIQERFYRPALVYEAPVNEKSKELREQLDIDEKTGYPRQYSWRKFASLGSEFRPDEAFIKLAGETKPGYDYSTKAAILMTTTFVIGSGQLIITTLAKMPWYVKPQYAISLWAITNAGLLWYTGRSAERQGWKNGIYVDYIRKHPDRFETMHRPKLREVLFEYYPMR